jgi:hypothetical protein
MRILNKILIIFLVLSLISVSALAEEVVEEELPFEVTLETVKDMIDFQENARFKITIHNPRESIERFSIKPGAPYVEWFIKTDPTSDYSVKAYPNSAREVFVIVKPLSVGTGRYAVRLNVKHEASGETFKKDLLINVISMSNVPSVSISGKLPSEIDPREPFVVTVWLENRNAKDLENIEVSLVSDAIRDGTITSLGPLDSGNDQKTLEFSIDLDDTTPPIKDSLRIVVKVEEGKEVYELKSAPYDYEVIQYGGLVAEHNKKLRFLGSYDELSFVNAANIKFEGMAKLENPFYKALFTKVSPSTDSFIEDGKRYSGWKVDLNPGESYDVVVKTNYIPLAILIIVVVLLIWGYYKFRSPLIITKTVQGVSKQEGGITGFKVMLHITNRSSKKAENIAIIDRLPDIADFEKSTEAGTLHPSKIVHSKRGVIAKWVIDSLDKDEESVIKYQARSRLSILGRLPLPITIGKFKDGKKVLRSYSNKVFISGKE